MEKYGFLQSWNGGSPPPLKVYLPFHFWFCNNPGLALL